MSVTESVIKCSVPSLRGHPSLFPSLKWVKVNVRKTAPCICRAPGDTARLDPGSDPGSDPETGPGSDLAVGPLDDLEVLDLDLEPLAAAISPSFLASGLAVET